MKIDELSLERTARNVESYEKSARSYDALCVNDPPPRIAAVLRRFAETLHRPARVLEVGSGPGRDADYLETLGVSVRRTDAVQAFLDIQAERGRKGELMNVVTDPLGGPYAGVLALCVLIHVDRAQTDPVLRKILDALTPGGALLVSMRVGEHVEDDSYHTVYWTRDGFAERLTAAGFAIDWDLDFVDSANDPWTIYCARGLAPKSTAKRHHAGTAHFEGTRHAARPPLRSRAVMRRLATRDDLDAVHGIYMHAEVVPFLGIDPVPVEPFRPVFDALLATRSFYVVPRDGVVRGFYRVTRHPGRARHAAALETLAIDPAEKGSGFARAMIDEALACMRAEGILRVELMVEADNPRGIAFYRKLGFEQEGRLRAAYKRAHEPHYVDEILMARMLAPA